MYPVGFTLLAFSALIVFFISAIAVYFQSGRRRLSGREWIEAIRSRQPWHLAVVASGAAFVFVLTALKLHRFLA
jgi:hypothetical protein